MGILRNIKVEEASALLDHIGLTNNDVMYSNPISLDSYDITVESMSQEELDAMLATFDNTQATIAEQNRLRKLQIYEELRQEYKFISTPAILEVLCALWPMLNVDKAPETLRLRIEEYMSVQ